MLGVKLNKKRTYILSCTGDAPSMCLVDNILKTGIKPIICFINYTNEEKPANQAFLETFCEQNSLKLETLSKGTGNENNEIFDQNDARDLRYQFFQSLYTKYDAAGLLIPHTQDELLEAYILRKKLNKTERTYGWNMVSEHNGMMVYRPLLQYSFEDVLNYNEENRVNYVTLSQDQVSLIVHPLKTEVIEKLTEIERENLLNEIKGELSDKAEFLDSLNKRIDTGDELDVREIMALNKNGFAETITRFINIVDESVKITKNLLESIRHMCLSQNENESLKLSDTLYITKEYDVLSIGGNLAKPLYSYELKKPGKLNTEYFSLDFSNGAADRGFRLSDYPLTIRPAVPEDLYNVHGFMTPVRKLYYDWRMPPKKKVLWPVIANKYGEIIYIPRYHRLHRTEHTSIFEIKFTEDD